MRDRAACLHVAGILKYEPSTDVRKKPRVLDCAVVLQDILSSQASQDAPDPINQVSANRNHVRNQVYYPKGRGHDVFYVYLRCFKLFCVSKLVF